MEPVIHGTHCPLTCFKLSPWRWQGFNRKVPWEDEERGTSKKGNRTNSPMRSIRVTSRTSGTLVAWRKSKELMWFVQIKGSLPWSSKQNSENDMVKKFDILGKNYKIPFHISTLTTWNNMYYTYGIEAVLYIHLSLDVSSTLAAQSCLLRSKSQWTQWQLFPCKHIQDSNPNLTWERASHHHIELLLSHKQDFFRSSHAWSGSSSNRWEWR